LIKINSDIDELISKYPEVVELDQTNEVEEVIKAVREECSDDMCQHNMKFGERVNFVKKSSSDTMQKGKMDQCCDNSDVRKEEALIPSLIGNNTCFQIKFLNNCIDC